MEHDNEGELQRSETILVAEDEAAIREIARRALESHGYRVLEAADGLEALSVLERHGGEIDLVLADLVMPRMGGSDLRREAQRLAPDVPFLMTTGYGSRGQTGEARRAAGAALLQKPWSVQELLERVRRELDAESGSG